MANAKESRRRPEATRFAEALETTQRFATVCLSYEQARQEDERATGKLCDEAYREYSKAVHKSGLDAQKVFEEASQHYWDTVQSAEAEEDARERVDEAQRNYHEKVRKAQETAQMRVAEAERTYRDKLNDAHLTGQKLSREAYRKYLRSVQELWSRLDVDALADAYALTSMGPRGS